MKQHRLAIVGLGDRSSALVKGMMRTCSSRFVMSAFVDPCPTSEIAFKHKFPELRVPYYTNYKELLNDSVLPDAVIIATPPRFHADITCAFLEAGVPVFLEKPLAHNLEDAARIVKTASHTAVRLHIGFNLRYGPFYVELNKIVRSGCLGQLLSIEWKEVITPRHWATYCWHPSYNRREMIGSWMLEKCCHDIDILGWLVESPCLRVASFGNRSHFKPRNDVPEYCTNNCLIEKDCAYSALKFYPELSSYEEAAPDIRSHCAYNTDSNLVDHQSAIMEYQNGTTVAFSLMPAGPVDCRMFHIVGSNATLTGNSERNEYRLYHHHAKEQTIKGPNIGLEEHGSADAPMMASFLDWLDDSSKRPKTCAHEGWRAMVTACAIDQARREHRVVEINACEYAVDVAIAQGSYVSSQDEQEIDLTCPRWKITSTE